ncbi:hypothetical protein ACHAXA_006299 [Cyclostephanos tholiformis]|uniref:Uncharacterized protein n=1 Tax=Cyclostephanos tholiformis TaxID=382380 RepID=A0ABD3R3R5_9STRA
MCVRGDDKCRSSPSSLSLIGPPPERSLVRNVRIGPTRDRWLNRRDDYSSTARVVSD